jgi:hypothetical protein
MRGDSGRAFDVFGAKLENAPRTNGKLAHELQAISKELDQFPAKEQESASELDRRFTEELGAIEKLLHAVEDAKLDGRWRNTRYNVFDVMGWPRLEEAHSSFLVRG